jgi:hypothetical protein
MVWRVVVYSTWRGVVAIKQVIVPGERAGADVSALIAVLFC